MAGSRDHCAQGGAAAPHLNTLSIQGEFFFNNKSHLLLGNARVMWPLCREMCPCHPPKYPPCSRWVFCDYTTCLLLEMPGSCDHCAQGCILSPTKIHYVFKVSFVVTQPISYWEMPGSSDLCTEGYIPATHQNTLRIQGEFFVIIQPVSYWEMSGSRDHCTEGYIPATHQNTHRIQGEFLVIIQPVSYWEMPGSLDHCAKGCAAATHQTIQFWSLTHYSTISLTTIFD